MTKCLSNIYEYVTIFTSIFTYSTSGIWDQWLVLTPGGVRKDKQLYPGEASDSGVSHKQLLNGESNIAGKQDKGPCTRVLEEQETLAVVS